MAYEQRDNSGAIFKNDKKETDSHPNGTGKAMIDGVMYYVSAWTKDGAKGKWQSLAFKRVDANASQPAKKEVADTPSIMDIDESLPF